MRPTLRVLCPLVLALFIGCSKEVKKPESPKAFFVVKAPNGVPLKYLKATVRIYDGLRPIGSGFFVGPNTICTAKHVVATPAQYMAEVNISGSVRALLFVEHVYTDPVMDIGFLKVTYDSKYVLPIASFEPEYGSEILVMGSPLGLPTSPTVGLYRGEFEGTMGLIMVDAFFGNSGGPAIDLETGLVVGMVVAGHPNYTQCTITEPYGSLAYALSEYKKLLPDLL